jgi:single-strand DNA-binding protein
MSRSLNKAMLIGNLGADPEIRTTSDGTKVAGFSIATNRSWTDREGRLQDRTEWHRVVAWTNLADIAEQYLHKGDRVYIEGEIQYRSYEDREAVTRYVTEIRARALVMLGGGNENGQSGGRVGAGDRQAVAAAGSRSEEPDSPAFPDEDLPF